MKFKLKNGMEVDLHDEDIKTIMNTYKSWQDEEEFDFEDMEEYFEEMKKKAISKMEHISQHLVSDEESIEKSLLYVMRNGSYYDFIQMLRYYMDWDISNHILASVK